MVPQIPNFLKCWKEASFVSGSSHAVDSHHLANKARTKMATQISWLLTIWRLKGSSTFFMKPFLDVSHSHAIQITDTFHGIGLPLSGSNEYQSTNKLKILVFTFLSTSMFVIKTWNKNSVQGEHVSMSNIGMHIYIYSYI